MMAGTPCTALGRAGYAALALGCLIGLTPAPAAAGPTDWTELRTLNIAHQGGEDEAPSNTMYALERAMRLGADMLELDVHTSRDGEVVVIHDGTVDRTTNGSGSVYEMSLADVQALDAGHNSVPGEGTEPGGPVSDYPFRGVRLGEKTPPPGFVPDDFRIPTLAEVMAAYPTVPTNIEIKGASDEDIGSFLRNAEALAELLNELGRSEGIVVASFSDLALARFHQLAPQIDTAAATAAVAAYKLAGVPPPDGTKVFQIPIELGGVPVTDEAFVDQLHADGYAIHNWTINDEPTMEQLLDWDVDGIMTAEPARLERVLCRTETSRQPRPPSFPGSHCSKRSSIACDVKAVEAALVPGAARVRLRRGDEFESRCAGRVAIKAPGNPGRSSASFNFGWLPPSQGGPAERTVKIRLPAELRGAIEQAGKAKVSARPFGAFIARGVLRVR